MHHSSQRDKKIHTHILMWVYFFTRLGPWPIRYNTHRSKLKMCHRHIFDASTVLKEKNKFVYLQAFTSVDACFFICVGEGLCALPQRAGMEPRPYKTIHRVVFLTPRQFSKRKYFIYKTPETLSFWGLLFGFYHKFTTITNTVII